MPKILVADDSIAVRKVAERLLTEAGLGVTLAANGEEALAYLSKERPDVIVSDVIMPDKSGYEVCAFVAPMRCWPPHLFYSFQALSMTKSPSKPNPVKRTAS